MRVVLTGAGGQVGASVLRAAPADIELIACDRNELDIADQGSVQKRIRELRPAVLINAAAYTAVDRAERDEAQARAVNEAGPRFLASAAGDVGARLIHLSTDYVFDGESSRPYAPEDQPRPLGIYGRTKLDGERAVMTALPTASVVLRTSWVYASSGQNFVLTMLRLMKERGSVRVVADQIGTPTAARSIAEVLWRLVRRPECRGVYHWTDAGVASWYDFAVAIAEEAAALGVIGNAEVTPIAAEDYPTAARRPRFSLLDSRRTAQELEIAQIHWRVWLRRVLGEMQIA